MASNLSTWESETLFRAGIEAMVYVLDDQVDEKDEARAAAHFRMLTPILDELSDRSDPLPALCADWFDLPRGSTFADFADLIRSVDSRMLAASIGLAYSALKVFVEYYQTGSEESFKSVLDVIALHHETHGACTDGSDDVLEIL